MTLNCYFLTFITIVLLFSVDLIRVIYKITAESKEAWVISVDIVFSAMW